jgi:hypothetical protein
MAGLQTCHHGDAWRIARPKTDILQAWAQSAPNRISSFEPSARKAEPAGRMRDTLSVGFFKIGAGDAEPAHEMMDLRAVHARQARGFHDIAVSPA